MKKQKHIDKFQKYTVIFGDALFISVILIEIIGAGLYINHLSGYSDSPLYFRYVTVTILMGLSAVSPPLVSYFAGVLSTKRKLPTLTHHFNGILFASTAFIVWLFLVTVNFSLAIPDELIAIPGRFMQFWPALATIILMIVLAISYAKSTTKDTALSFKPFAVTLLIAVVGSILTGLYSQVDIVRDTHTLHALLNNLLPGTLGLIAMLGMLIFAYTLKRLRPYPFLNRAASAAAMTLIGMLAFSVISQIGARFITGLGPLTISVMATLIGLCIWIVYLRMISAHSRG